MAYIDDIQKLHSQPGYNSSLAVFQDKFYGGEPVMQCFEAALLAFMKPEDTLFNCFKSSNPMEQMEALTKLGIGK